jgi:hypothetical protein
MKIKKMIAVKAETLAEEQELLRMFPNSYWRPGSDNAGKDFATFYLPESYIVELKEEWIQGR